MWNMFPQRDVQTSYFQRFYLFFQKNTATPLRNQMVGPLAFSSFKLFISSKSNDTRLCNSENLSEKTSAMLSSVPALSILFWLTLIVTFNSFNI